MNSERNTVRRGFAALALANVLVLVVGWAVVACFPREGPGPWYPPLAPPVYLFGATQFLWALPWQAWAFASGRRRFGLGLVLAAVATLLANAGLFLYAMGAMDLPH